MSSRVYGRNAFETNLDGAITAGATSIALDDATGLTAPGYLVLEPEDASLREYIKYAGISTNTLTGVSRGLDGSASGAQAHTSGAKVRMVFVHQYLNDIFTDIEALETADANHIGGTDTADHPEASVSTRGFMSAADKTKLDAVPQPITESDITDLDHDDTDAIHDNVSGEIAAVTLKASPHVNDLILIEDSEAANAKKRATVSSVVSAGSSTDHGVLTGLGDDDHSQYLLADGSRDLAGRLQPDADDTRNLGGDGRRFDTFWVKQIAGSGPTFNNTAIDIENRKLTDNDWRIATASPNTSLTDDLGSHIDDNIEGTRIWRRLYVTEIRDRSNNVVFDIDTLDPSSENDAILRVDSGVVSWGGLESLVQLDEGQNNADGALTTGWVDQVTVSFTPPAAWNTYRVMISGGITIRGGSASTEFQARVGDGTSFGAAADGAVGSVTTYATANPAVAATFSGSKTFQLEARQTDGGAAATRETATIWYIAFRLT